ncbi:MAG: DUF547 domain-containing protein [bacterium]
MTRHKQFSTVRKRFLLFFMTIWLLPLSAHAIEFDDFSYYSGQRSEPIDNSLWANFLENYVVIGDDGINRVAYGFVTEQDHQQLKTYIQQLSAINPTDLSTDEGFAFWVNLYNAQTIDIILDNYPVQSIRDIRTGLRAGPWKRKVVTINGEALSLDNIEHDILRRHWRDQRVHYAVNCASIGCPNLARKPYEGAVLDAQLDAAAKAYINHARGVHFDDRGRMTVSKIYQWFREDFGNSDMEVVAHIRRYADDDLRDRLSNITKITRYEYDWSLNDAKEMPEQPDTASAGQASTQQ